MIRLPLKYSILLELGLIVMWIDGRLSDYGIFVVIINGILILAPFSPYIFEFLWFLCCIPFRKYKQKKADEVKAGTEAINHLLSVQDNNARMISRANSLVWLYKHTCKPISKRAKRNFYNALEEHTNEFGNPIDKLAIIKFIADYHEHLTYASRLNVILKPYTYSYRDILSIDATLKRVNIKKIKKMLSKASDSI